MARTKLGHRVGRRVRARREARGISQAELAARVGVSANYVGLIERGSKVPTIETLFAFAKALDVKGAELLDETVGADEWVGEVIAVAQSIPKAQRQLVLALLRAVATHR
jgi:transcriptional regulator with XRE-family HTH domain